MLDISSLEKAIISLNEIIAKTTDSKFMNAQDEVTVNGLKSGVIQHFEFTYELAWKFIKRYLEANLGSIYVDGVSRRELFRLAFESQLINNVDTWMGYHYSRNRTTHTYNTDTADEVYEVAKQFLNDAKQFLEELKKRND